MKVAIFSDVHGNLTAFEAVLADIQRQGPDITFFAGDLCLMGARPKACLDLLEGEGIPAVYGNTDDWINDTLVVAEVETAEEAERVQMFNDLSTWTVNEIGELGQAVLRTWPFHRRISPSTHPKDDLLIVHANPVGVLQPIFPNESVQQAIYGEIKQPDDDPSLRHLLSELDCGVMAFGHVHIPNVREWNGRSGPVTLANISSVSLPLDGDARAKYGLLSWQAGEGWTIDQQYVEYDIEGEREWISRVKPPGWESLSERLS